MLWGVLAAVVVLGLVTLRILNVRRLRAIFANPGYLVMLSSPAHHALEQLKAKLEPELGPISEVERTDNPLESTFQSHLLICDEKFTIGASPAMGDDLRPQFADQYADPRAKEIIRACYGGLTIQCFTDGRRASDLHHKLLIKVTHLMIDDRAIGLGTDPSSNILPFEGALKKAVEEEDFVTVMRTLTGGDTEPNGDDDFAETEDAEAGKGESG